MAGREGILTQSMGAAGTLAPDTSIVPDAARLRVYALWAGWAGVAFFAVYPALNWLTSLRPSRYHFYVSPELGIPFVPQFIWAYLSMYALLLMPMFLLPATRMPGENS
jgi:hypothetical protein